MCESVYVCVLCSSCTFGKIHTGRGRGWCPSRRCVKPDSPRHPRPATPYVTLPHLCVSTAGSTGSRVSEETDCFSSVPTQSPMQLALISELTASVWAMPNVPPDSFVSCTHVLLSCYFFESLWKRPGTSIFKSSISRWIEEPELFHVRALSCVHLPAAGPLCTGVFAVTSWRRRRAGGGVGGGEKDCFNVPCFYFHPAGGWSKHDNVPRDFQTLPPHHHHHHPTFRMCACVYIYKKKNN